MHVGSSDLSAATTAFATLDALDFRQHRIAQLFAVSPRHIRRWKSGARRTPRAVGILCNLLVMRVVTIEQVEEAAAAIPVQTNGSAQGKPSTPLKPTPAPARADLSLSTAAKVYALASGACRWPCGDPRRPDFRFCGDPAVKGPYCEQHCTMAYMAPRTGGRHGAGFQSAPPAVSLTQVHDLGCRPLAADNPDQQVGPLIERDPLLIGIGGVVVSASDAGAVSAIVPKHSLDHMRRDVEPVVHDSANCPA